MNTPCPCGLPHRYEDCCGRYTCDHAPAPNAEALMRSRYTAYALRLESYLLATWHPDTRPATLNLEDEPQPKWLGLQVKSHRQIDEIHAEVEFVARCKIGGRAHRMHETSRFVLMAGRWYYADGDVTGSGNSRMNSVCASK
ncbi:MAG: SEC-C domain-containing protein [Betaproteobacteria bacterium]|nr:SEC-C domain-containing protein [Betaproteobacteria bacterium]